MNPWAILSTFDLLLWLIMAVSTSYVLFFALASLLPQRSRLPISSPTTPPVRHNAFLVLFPAYHEDSVIRTSVETFLRQDYPRDCYQVVVISDHMTAETNNWLAQQPITLLTPQFTKSSKAQALQYAMGSDQLKVKNDKFQKVVILDADNVVSPDFLTRLNAECQKGHHTIQCHRTAKNADSDIALLDGVSEEINNSIFRRGHNRIGLSSALIGSGMCFDYEWFANHVNRLTTAGEDKELEAMLLWERVHIHYAEDILVMDEKVSGSDIFQRQRLRWMTAQVQCLKAMLPSIPRALATLRIDYIDKTLQQALIPRSMLLMSITAMALLAQCTQFIVQGLSINHELYTMFSLKWWLLLASLSLGLFIAIPARLRTRTLVSKVMTVPQMAWRMLKNVFHIKPSNKDFIHTSHGEPLSK